jgi:hypothetical protein
MKSKPNQRPPRSSREQALDGPIFLKERGSVEWCYQKVAFLKDVLQMEQATVRQFNDALNDLKEFKAWEKIPENQPYGDLPTLLKTELGIDSEDDGRSLIERRISAAAAKTDGKTLGRGGDRKSHGYKSMLVTSNDSQVERAKRNGISRDTQQRLDRLARKAPEICQLVASGQIGLVEAERAAKIVKETLLQRVQSAWRKAGHTERQRIKQWILAQNGEGNSHGERPGAPY